MVPNCETLATRSLLHKHTTLNYEQEAAVYFGIDPTAGSLHIGHLPLLLTLCHFYEGGYRPIVLLGGGTARIGDPSGKNIERPNLESNVIENNLRGLEKGLRSFWNGYLSVKRRKAGLLNEDDNSCGQDDLIHLLIMNNEEWFKNQGILDFITLVGHHMNVATMLSRDSVKKRMDRGGISLLEFMYQSFQAFDYYQLFQKFNCRVQIGGSDQWGVFDVEDKL